MHEATDGTVEDKSDAESRLQAAAESIRELASAKEESAANIESGFGHTTSLSEELSEMADSLKSWADDVEATDLEEDPEPETDGECDQCGGTGHATEDVAEGEAEGAECEQCKGSGRFTPTS